MLKNLFIFTVLCGILFSGSAFANGERNADYGDHYNKHRNFDRDYDHRNRDRFRDHDRRHRDRHPSSHPHRNRDRRYTPEYTMNIACSSNFHRPGQIYYCKLPYRSVTSINIHNPNCIWGRTFFITQWGDLAVSGFCSGIFQVRGY